MAKARMHIKKVGEAALNVGQRNTVMQVFPIKLYSVGLNGWLCVRFPRPNSRRILARSVRALVVGYCEESTLRTYVF